MKRFRLHAFVFSGVLAVALFLPLVLCAAKPDARFKALRRKGFPADYAKPLAKLKKNHPAWEFEPLLVSKMESRYTWNYVIEQETAHPKRSLISGGKHTAPYFHATDTNEYDAGCRRASPEAVAFFLDPRNFLNERDIFQFEDLQNSRAVPLRAVQAVLSGTFMAKGKLENGKTHAEYLLILSNELGVSPLHLAARVRMEQGLEGTPLVSGQCGTRLWNYYHDKVQSEGRFAVLTPASGFDKESLLALDNLYNYFNQEAAGTGRFTIYLNGMREAQRGTPEMAKAWGGNPAWNTRWKALYGGAFKVAHKYVGNFQNTPYLQKWNVDPRSKTPSGGRRNFWGQYMQNIGAAFSEGKSTYDARRNLRMLDCPYRFLIPVYSGMPDAPSPDPAGGQCVWYPAYANDER